MKKFLGVFSVVVMVVLLGGCGQKAKANVATDTFTQSPMDGTEVSIIVEHEGDKITNVSAKAVFDNKKLKIDDEKSAEQVTKAFETASNLEDAEMKYTEKETVITYEAPEESVKSGSSFKEGSEQLTKIGFEKK